MTSKKTLVDQMRGATRLAVAATSGITDIVQAVHQTIGAGPDILGKPWESLTKFFITPTYTTVRGVTKVVSSVLEHALTRLDPLLDQPAAERGHVLAIVNSVVGDYLVTTGNPLAISMGLYSQGKLLDVSPESLQQAFPNVRRICLFLHGTCLDESTWTRKGHSHAEALAHDRGLVPIYLRYNCGKHISENGREFAEILEQLVKSWPQPLDDLVLLGHSMGGLVARSACLIAEEKNYTWRKQVKALITLGTPHHGAPLERAGNWVDMILGANRYSAPFAWLGQLRSAGITDLRYGYVADADWQGRDRFARSRDHRGPQSLPHHIACFTVAGTIKKVHHRALPGDGIVPLNSALGRHKDPKLTLNFREGHQLIALGTSHLELLGSQVVYRQILEWLDSVLTPWQTTIAVGEPALIEK